MISYSKSGLTEGIDLNNSKTTKNAHFITIGILMVGLNFKSTTINLYI